MILCEFRAIRQSGSHVQNPLSKTKDGEGRGKIAKYSVQVLDRVTNI